ncbi:hypothetical protein OG563_26865 [Nocardia vinacea]|uniref:Uncharacterized protein n=1 Tax=Nocardia vinacea TaxID=96468 RepID=A0ABZ1YI43_9NOCA|nr:hypothetical protein [Nocardia vinacea]
MAGPTVSVATARKHLDYLVEHETSRKRISRESGVARQTIIGILQGVTQRIAPETEQQLLRVRPAAPPIPAGHVDALGSRRRVQALIATGHAVPVIAARARLSIAEITEIALGRRLSVSEATAAKLRRVFTELELVIGRSPAARRMGASHRWSLPLEWDDDKLDDPQHRPCKTSKARMREIAEATTKSGAAGPVRRRVVAAL